MSIEPLAEPKLEDAPAIPAAAFSTAAPPALAIDHVPDDAPDDADVEDTSPAAVPFARSIRHLMKRSLGGEQDALTAESADAVERCTAEFLSFVASEARGRACRDGRSTVTEADLLSTLNTLGFKSYVEPLKAHMQRNYGGARLRAPPKEKAPKRQRAVSPLAAASSTSPAAGVPAAVKSEANDLPHAAQHDAAPVAPDAAAVGAPAAGASPSAQSFSPHGPAADAMAAAAPPPSAPADAVAECVAACTAPASAPAAEPPQAAAGATGSA